MYGWTSRYGAAPPTLPFRRWGSSSPTAARRGNARRYRAELAALDVWVGESLGSIPEQQRVLVTAHDAFGYYARAYGLTVVGIQGLGTASEAAISDVRRVVDTVAERRVPAIFAESSVNARTVSAVQQTATARGVSVGGSLYSDALGEAGTAAGTYCTGNPARNSAAGSATCRSARRSTGTFRRRLWRS